MSDFTGFTDAETLTPVPDSFFRALLKEIKDIDELKVTLYAIWWIEHMEGPFRALREVDFDPERLGLSANKIRRGLEKAVERGSLLKVRKDATLYFLLNSPRGRAVFQALESGKWNPEVMDFIPPVERPNIFKLYEENIGPLTPLIADALKDAEEEYSAEWIAESIELAVKNNKRNWKYCEAILRRWKEEGRAEKQDRRDAEKDRRKYIQGEYADYIEH
ncbi:MAG TPA: DnaD domain protein [Anaerolineales bacterium]|nr:DnaD domain protein [Anaerolineales bacterium]